MGTVVGTGGSPVATSGSDVVVVVVEVVEVVVVVVVPPGGTSGTISGTVWKTSVDVDVDESVVVDGLVDVVDGAGNVVVVAAEGGGDGGVGRAVVGGVKTCGAVVDVAG